jgi:hypothetical protein
MQYSQIAKVAAASQSTASVGSTSIDSSGAFSFAGRSYTVSFNPAYSGFSNAFTFSPSDGTSPTVKHWWEAKTGNALMLCDTSAATSPTPTSHLLVPSNYEPVSYTQFVDGVHATFSFWKVRDCARVGGVVGQEPSQGWISPLSGAFSEDGLSAYSSPDVFEMMSDAGLLKFNERMYLRLFRQWVNGNPYYLIAFWRDSVDAGVQDKFLLGFQLAPQ